MNRNHNVQVEHDLIDRIDEERVVKKVFLDLIPTIKLILQNGGVKEAFEKGAPAMVLELFKIATESTSDAVKLKAINSLLDRAGYKPIEKHMNLNIPENMVNAQLESKLKNLTEEERTALLKYLVRNSA